MNFTTGRQPCQNFHAKDELFNGSGNVHECFAPFDTKGVPRCAESGGCVSYCDNCLRDHHSDGYETCSPLPADAAKRETR